MKETSRVGNVSAAKGNSVPRRARIYSSQTFVSLNSRLESNKEEEEQGQLRFSKVVTGEHRFQCYGELRFQRGTP